MVSIGSYGQRSVRFEIAGSLGGATVHDETDTSYYSRGLIELSCSCVGKSIILIHAQCAVKDV
jgi:hypothetical protein